MGQRVLLIDSDVFILLAGAGLLCRAVELLGFKMEDVRRLSALESQLTRGQKFLKTYPEAVRQTALEMCKVVQPLTEQLADVATQEQLGRIDAIDYGEALMFATLAEQPLYYLTSGDKRSMAALAKEPTVSEVHRKLVGRIICLESIIEMLVRKDGCEAVARGFTPLCGCNKTLKVIFSNGAQSTQEHVVDATASYLNALVKEVGPGFLMQL